MNKILPENDKNQNNVQSMRPNWDTINLTGTPLQIFLLLQESVSNSRSDQLKKSLQTLKYLKFKVFQIGRKLKFVVFQLERMDCISYNRKNSRPTCKTS